MPLDPSAPLPDRADLLIVGAGISGLYAGWRYLDAHPGADVVIVDRLNRVGGRLQTDLVEIPVPGGDPVTVRDEEGGMRFNYGMEELMALFEALGLCDQIVPFPMTGAHNRYLFRGRSFTYEQAQADPGIWSELFRLAPAEQNRQPVEILGEAYHRAFDANRERLAAEGYDAVPEAPTPEYWQTFRLVGEWDGTPLYKWQLWGLLRAMGYTEECCTMLARTLGFEGPFWSTMNAGEAFQLMEDFPSDPTYFTFEDGFSTLIDAITAEVEARGATVALSTNVDRIRQRDDGAFRADLTRAPEGHNASPAVAGGAPATVRADRVVLALPRKALETLYATSTALNRRHEYDDAARRGEAVALWDALQTTTDQRLLKINLYFDHAWWQSLQLPVAYGPSFADLPVGAVYPFYSLRGVEADRAATDPPDPSLPAALTIYCDWDNTNFWQGLQAVGPMFDSALQRQHSAVPQTLFPASQAVVREVLALFRDLYNTAQVPDPILTSFRLWDGEHDFGYAVHQWGIGADDGVVIPLLAQPFEGVPLYTCNEAYSDMQGWVNGSLRSTELVLRKLGVEPLKDTATPAPTCSDAWTKHRDDVALTGGGLWGIGAVPRR